MNINSKNKYTSITDCNDKDDRYRSSCNQTFLAEGGEGNKNTSLQDGGGSDSYTKIYGFSADQNPKEREVNELREKIKE